MELKSHCPENNQAGEAAGDMLSVSYDNFSEPKQVP